MAGQKHFGEPWSLRRPSYRGWGGRYKLFQSYAESGKIWTSTVNTQDEVTLPDGSRDASNQATIWRWREAYQNDFAARMDWNIISDFKKVNHNPVISLNSNFGKAIVRGRFKAGEPVHLSAEGSRDPDGHQLSYNWFVYWEINEFHGNLHFDSHQTPELRFTMPELENGQELHIILEVRDSGEPSLYSYRRVILSH